MSIDATAKHGNNRSGHLPPPVLTTAWVPEGCKVGRGFRVPCLVRVRHAAGLVRSNSSEEGKQDGRTDHHPGIVRTVTHGGPGHWNCAVISPTDSSRSQTTC